MSLEGEKLAAKYSYNCWRARKIGINDLLLDFVQKGNNREKTVKELQKLASYSWYVIIASNNDISDPFDERVVRAYWTGDDDLIRVIKNDINSLLPFHNFTVLGAIHRNSDIDIDDCKISAARVVETGETVISVRHKAIVRDQDDKFYFAERPETKKIKKGFVGKIAREEWIIYHLGIARETIREEEAIRFYRRTEQAIKLFNESSE